MSALHSVILGQTLILFISPFYSNSTIYYATLNYGKFNINYFLHILVIYCRNRDFFLSKVLIKSVLKNSKVFHN